MFVSVVDVWSPRCWCQWLEGQYSIQGRIQSQPSCDIKLLEGNLPLIVCYLKKCDEVNWLSQHDHRERSGSVVECLTRDWRAAESSLTGVTALCHWERHIYPSLVLVQPRKTRPCLTERLLMGRKESNQHDHSCWLGSKTSSKTKNKHVIAIWTLWIGKGDALDRDNYRGFKLTGHEVPREVYQWPLRL